MNVFLKQRKSSDDVRANVFAMQSQVKSKMSDSYCGYNYDFTKTTNLDILMYTISVAE